MLWSYYVSETFLCSKLRFPSSQHENSLDLFTITRSISFFGCDERSINNVELVAREQFIVEAEPSSRDFGRIIYIENLKQ